MRAIAPISSSIRNAIFYAWKICSEYTPAMLVACTLILISYNSHLTAQTETRAIEFVVVIPSYNNEKWFEKNLDSVRNQTYDKWSAIYINDNSSDRTGTYVEEYIQKYDLKDRITVIHTKEPGCPIKSHYTAIRGIDPGKVVVCLDGDDWLAHNQVLELLAKIYQDSNVWITYGNYRSTNLSSQHSCCKPLPKRVIKKQRFRNSPWVTSHLKTFYAALFQRIKKEDLMYNGGFIPMAGDMAMMLPMLEMASQGHIRYIPEILYIYNVHNPLNEDKINRAFQAQIDKEIRSRKIYSPVQSLF